MPTSRDTSLKWGMEAVCALATRGKIRTSDRIFRITMSVPIIEQRKLINHEVHIGFQPQRAQRNTEGTRSEYCLCAASLLLCVLRGEERGSCRISFFLI